MTERQLKKLAEEFTRYLVNGKDKGSPELAISEFWYIQFGRINQDQAAELFKYWRENNSI